MLMRAKTALLVALFLAACGQSGETGATKGGATSIAPVSSGPLRAGLYRVVQTGDVEIEQEHCIDAAAVAAGRFVLPGEMEEGWKVETNRMSDGKIEVAAHHISGSRMNIQGTFAEDSFSTEGTLEMKVNGETHVVRTGQRGQFVSTTCPSA